MSIIKGKYKRIQIIDEYEGKIVEKVDQIYEKNHPLILKSYPTDDAKSI
jgi:hypothetical protein